MADQRPRVLVVDDKPEMVEMLAEGLSERGYDPIGLTSGREALALLEQGEVDALVTDLRMPGVDGAALLAASRKGNPSRPVIVMTAYAGIDSAIESIRQGAYHYLTKPFKLEELAIFLGRALEESTVRREAAALRETLKERFSPPGFVGASKAMAEVLDVAERVARTDAPVLITGETGTGKGMVARAIHAASRRANARFVAVNCAALPSALLESELFGHVKGAFTGATEDRPGLFAEADRGTLLLDEVGEMPLELQAKLLHVLEARTVRPVGASRERPVDVRVITATHRDLRARVASGQFRDDLLYRLDVVPLHIPPLRERADDVPLLLESFLRDARARHPDSPVRGFSAEALATLSAYAWPGNVRELAHLVERLVVLGRTAEVSTAELPASVRTPPFAGAWGGDDREVLPIRELQRRYAAWALARCGGHRGRTAERLGVDPKTLAKWLGEAGDADAGSPRS